MDRRPVLERERTIHIGFGGIEFGIEEQLEVELSVVQTDSDGRSGQPVAEYVGFAVGVANSQRALAYEAPQEIGQKTHLVVLHCKNSLLVVQRSPAYLETDTLQPACTADQLSAFHP